MDRAILRFWAVLLGSVVAAAPGLAAPIQAPPPAVSGPVAVPYPDTVPSIEVMALSWRAADAVQQRLTSDPEEGGQIAQAKDRKRPSVSISELTVTKKTDVASPTLLESTTGGAAPPPRGTATITVARGHCASGQHFPAVRLTMRGQSHTFKDVDVVSCAPAGDNTDTCTLSYRDVAG